MEVVAVCGAIGLVTSLFVLIAQYYTDYKYPRAKAIAEASRAGPGAKPSPGWRSGWIARLFPSW